MAGTVARLQRRSAPTPWVCACIVARRVEVKSCLASPRSANIALMKTAGSPAAIAHASGRETVAS